MVISGVPQKPKFTHIQKSDLPPKPLGQTPIYFGGKWQTANIFKRLELRAGHRFSGPSIVIQEDATSCILEGYISELDKFGNLILTLEAKE